MPSKAWVAPNPVLLLGALLLEPQGQATEPRRITILNRNSLIAIAALIIILSVMFVGVIFPLAIPGTRDVNNYGIVTVHSLYGADKSAISVGGTLDAEDGLFVKWLPDTDYTGEVTCDLYTVSGTWLESGNWNLVTGGAQIIHGWGFILDNIPKGTTAVYCAFGGQYTEDISWVGSTIGFVIESTVESTYDLVVFTVEQADTSGAGGELIDLRWWFVSEGPATGTITVDGAKVSSRGITPSPNAQPFTYSFSENEKGSYTVKLTITPESGDSVSSSCEVTITSKAIDTTTTTTPTTTTDTGTTTNGNGDEDEFPFFYIMLAVIVIVGLIIVAKVA